MNNQSALLLSELEAAADRAIDAIVHNSTSELEHIVIQQVQILNKVTTLPENILDKDRLRTIKKKIEQQQVLVAQSLNVVDSFFQILSEYRQFSRSG